MTHSHARAHVVYLDIPFERTAIAACYGCGTRVPAQYMIWMPGPHAGTFVALCGVCYRDAQDDGMADGEDPDCYRSLQVLEQPIPSYLQS